ncbi:uncharacterized protein B0P05DRAFT_329413 [Gilbertella persicaria]|uniref:uncharacterized protein n=1 Tax=Gilbertella persicaria TaxID=101096 RepID=UPI00221F715C|nr:uncharacterized protein B0P05DRAFT_329413 [Gilbertella persicaria]KAI8090241.1 hypothetical protein B0P05DRAFT_329413 [Gilbertella persicaria]
MSTEQKLISNKTPVILPKISPSMTLEEMSKTLLIASAVYNSSLTPLPSPQQQHQHESPKKDPTEEEKRKRNTAASARFRIKKKQREQTMEKTVKEMAEKSTTLENRVKELELEIKFLRNLLIEKNAS